MLAILITAAQLTLLRALVWLVIAIGLGLAAHRIIDRLVVRRAARESVLATALVRRTRRPASFILPFIAITVIAPHIVLPAAWQKNAVHLGSLATIAAATWTVIAIVRVWSDVITARYRFDVDENLVARELNTRVAILSRIVVLIAAAVGAGMILLTFPPIRALGTTLLASAGIIGIAAGIAARPVFENLIAGLQLALTQPIRIDDVVIVEGEFGRIEEISSTFVVVALWDLRRLIVPLTYFTTTPFQNWTRTTANLIGEVQCSADYSCDVEALRQAFPRILARSPLWDGKVQNVQVIDATEKTIRLRCLVSATDSGKLWDLRCWAREALIAHLRETQRSALPYARVHVAEEH